MTTPEDCRRKSEQWLDSAKSATDPTTSAMMRRVSELWTALAQQIEGSNSSPVRLPRDLATSVNRRSNTVQVGEVLRNRLQIADEPDEITL